MLPSPGAYNTFTSVDKEMHARKRKVMSQGLTDQCIRRFEPTLLAHVDVFIKRLCRGAVGAWPAQALNMTECCRHLSYDVMGAFGFGQPFRMQTSDDNHFLLHAVKALMHKVSVYVQHPALQTLRLEALFSRRSSRMRARYARLMADLVQRRLAAGRDAQHDLFAFLAHAGEFSADELWAESRFLLIAGTFAAPLLAHCFADARLASCGYLRASMDEAMRMSPPIATTLWREVCADDGLVVDGLLLPRGVDVGVSPYALHHNERLFPDSFAFCPERWIVSANTSPADVERMRRAFSVFSVGPRACAGRRLAYVELSDALARTVWYLDLYSADGFLASLQGGQVGARYGRHRAREFQLEDHITCHHDGPYLRFRVRPGAEQEALRLLAEQCRGEAGGC